MKRLLVALALLSMVACQKSIRLQSLPALGGNGQAALRVVLTYDRNNQLFVALSGVADGVYVAWTIPSGAGASSAPVNVGQIRVAGGKGSIATLTPLRQFNVMITREDKGDTQTPSAAVVFKGVKEISW
jgi:hypothetical protein